MANREPDLRGIAKAWHIRETPEIKAAHVASWGYEDSGIDGWIINGPYHPFWSWWYVACISLRPVEGAPPTHKQYPEAEYELTFWSLQYPTDIELLEAGRIDEQKGLGFLHPADVTFQFHGLSDKQAAQLCEIAVRTIVNGQSCDSDYRSWWLNALAQTVAHMRTGAHENGAR